MKTVPVASFRYRHEGEIARAYLDAAGIRSILVADDAGGFRPEIMSANPVRVLVAEEEVEHALEVLSVEGEILEEDLDFEEP